MFTKFFFRISAQIHPDRGGMFDQSRASNCQKISARAYEQCQRAAEFAARKRSTEIHRDFIVPNIILFTVQPSDEMEMLRETEE
jgi:hypothetical protein